MAKKKRATITFTLRHTLDLGMDKVFAVDISRDGALVAASTNSGMVVVGDVATGAVRYTIKEHKGAVHAVAFDPSGAQLFTGGADLTMRLWSMEDGAFMGDLAGIVNAPRSRTLQGQMLQPSRVGHTQTLLAAVWNDDGVLATGGQDFLVKLWPSESAVRTFNWHQGPITDLVFRPGTDRPYSASRDGTVRAWDVAAGAMTEKYSGHDDEIEALVWLGPDHFVSGDLGGQLLLWKAGDERPFAELVRVESAVRCLAAVPAQRVVLAGLESGDVVAYEARKRLRRDPPPPITVCEAHDLAVRALAATPDGSVLVSGGNDGQVHVWDIG